MKFTSILRSIILEDSRFDVLFTSLTKPSVNKDGVKVKAKLSKEEFVELIKADPTTRLNNVNLDNLQDFKEASNIKVGKYVQWLIKNYLSPKTERSPEDRGYSQEVEQVKSVFMEDLYKVIDDLKKFERFKGRIPENLRDINKLTPDKLYDAVKDFDLTIATTTKSERKLAPVHPGAKLAYSGNKWSVFEIQDKGALGKEAACFYGGNNEETRWCTSGPGLTYFERYIKDGPLYVIYDPNDTNVAAATGLPKRRYQFHFPSNQFMDKDDKDVNLTKMLNGEMSDLKEFFKPEFAKGLTIGGTRLSIDGFTQGAIGKFVGLYGIDDLFKSLPDTIEEFQVQNRDNNNIVITIPKEISKFKNIHMILLDNCINSLPDEICDLPKLRFLSLINNPGLKTIPECLSKVKTLSFLNLNGSNNVVIPEFAKERGDDIGDGMWDLQ